MRIVDSVLCALFLLLLAIYTLRSTVWPSEATHSASPRADVPSWMNSVPRVNASAEPVAIASIAVGPKARFSAAYLLRSFIRNSNFNGPFYLITDSPSYFDFLQQDLDEHPQSRVVYLRITDSRIGDMPLPLLPLSTVFKINRYGQTLWQRFSDFKRKRLEIKWLKTKLFNFIPDHPYVVFMDSDMLIGQDLAPFVDHCMAKRRTPHGDAVVTLFTDIGNTGSRYHTGVVWFSREHSADLLTVWGITISRGIFPSDQRAIEYTINQLDDADRVSFITIDDESRFFAFINGTCVERGKPYTFMHTTSYRLATGAKFGFTNETLMAHFDTVYHTPWKPWTGADSMSYEEQVQQLEAKMQLKRDEIERLENAPFKKPTVIAHRKELLAEMEAELKALVESKGKKLFKDYGGGGDGDEKPALDNADDNIAD